MVLILVFVTVLLFVLGTALSIGSVQVPFTMVWKVVAHRVFPEGVISVEWTPAIDRIVADTRLPRVLLAAVAGMALTTVGTVVQALLRNPLANP
ncbi:iron chelate uptake ABC transporter family permease subunit, partial [Campylobacter jejuni]